MINGLTQYRVSIYTCTNVMNSNSHNAFTIVSTIQTQLIIASQPNNLNILNYLNSKVILNLQYCTSM